MAQWFQNLKSFLHVDLSGVQEIKATVLSGNKGNKVGLINFEKIDNSRHLTLNVGSDDLKDPKKRAELQEIIKQSSLEFADRPLLEAHVSKEVEEITAAEDNDDLPEYFRGKVPDSDIPILKAAAFIKQLHERGDRRGVQRYKEELRERYGKRADNITNLYTPGYFDSHIKPMYEELSKRPNFSRRMFIENYEVLVEGSPFAVFVKRSEKRDDLITEVISKITTNRSYGIKTLNIHAIADINVKLLKSILEDPKITKEFTDPPSISSEGYSMIARIYF